MHAVEVFAADQLTCVEQTLWPLGIVQDVGLTETLPVGLLGGFGKPLRTSCTGPFQAEADGLTTQK